MEQRPISPDDVFWQLASLNQRIARIEQLLELLPILLVTQVDPTHLSIDSAAKIIGVSTKTIRRRIRARKLRLDVYVGTRRTGIPIEQPSMDGWIYASPEQRWLVNAHRWRRRTMIDDKKGGEIGRLHGRLHGCHRRP